MQDRSTDRPYRRELAVGLAVVGMLVAAPAVAQQEAQAPLATTIGIIFRPQEAPASYDAEAVPEDEGVAGARMGIADDNTTGRFTKQSFTLEEKPLPPPTPTPSRLPRNWSARASTTSCSPCRPIRCSRSPTR